MSWSTGTGKWSVQAGIALIVVGGFVAGTLGVGGIAVVTEGGLLALAALAGSIVNHYFPGGKRD